MYSFIQQTCVDCLLDAKHYSGGRITVRDEENRQGSHSQGAYILVTFQTDTSLIKVARLKLQAMSPL